MKRIIAIVGPTGVGKSAMALNLAQCLPIEIVNADSRQVYRQMNIGTGKPSASEMKLSPHHLIDIVEPNQEFNLALYLNLARQTIAEIYKRRKTPVLVGGTGQYMWAMLEGWRVPAIPPNKILRERLIRRTETEGSNVLFDDLKTLDPDAASRVDPRNLRRVIRALELFYETGKSYAQVKEIEGLAYRALVIGLYVDRADLYQQIDERIEQMLALGWLDEVRSLMRNDYSSNLPSMSSLGYRELAQHLQGILTLDEAIYRIKIASHRLARRQANWFRLSDPRIKWLDIKRQGTDFIRDYILSCFP